MKGFLLSFRYAFNGIRVAMKQRNLQVQLLVGVIVIAAGFYFQISGTDWSIILFCIALVLSLEMINSAIENLVNLVTQEWHPLAGKVKDIAAGAVLVASVLVAIIGGIVFYKYIFQLT